MNILTKSPALIPQPRTVDTFPSGLVRVTQTYIGRTALKATHRATLAVGSDMPDGNSSPCIDGLKIFPEAQERAREDGMTEYIVTAYGRVNTTGKKTFEQDLSSCSSTFSVKNFIWDIETQSESTLINDVPSLQPVTVDRLIWVFCAKKNVQTSILPTDTPRVYNYDGSELLSRNFLEALQASLLSGNLVGYFNEGGLKAPSTVVRSIIKSFEVNSIEKSNFGSFDEWTVTYTQPPPTFNFKGLAGFWTPARISPLSSINNLLPFNDTVETETLGEVWNLNSTSGGINENLVGDYVQLTDSFQNTPSGRAKIQRSGVIWSINNQFGYYVSSDFDSSLNFVPFSRPPGGTYGEADPAPSAVTQGAAVWRPRITSSGSDSGGGYNTYVYNLEGSAIYAWYRWTLSNEFGQTRSFTGRAEFRPEVL
jgi:hypothetical protein